MTTMLTRIPVDSSEAAELREYANAGLEEHSDRMVHDARCRGGWLGEDTDGRPVACGHCRPHVLAARCTVCAMAAANCDAQRGRIGERCCNGCRHERTQP